MIKINIPEPLSPKRVYIFKKKIKNLQKADIYLRIARAQCLSALDEIDERTRILDYELCIKNKKTEYKSLRGGMDLSIEEARRYSLPELKRDIQRLFDNSLESLPKYKVPITLDIQITSFRDAITKQVEAFNPRT